MNKQVVIGKSKDCIIIRVALWVFGLFVFFAMAESSMSTPVSAIGGGSGGSTSGGGVPCVKNGQLQGTLCTRYGARWQYYTTSSNDVYITGKGKDYSRSGHITGCAAVGGYWRYGMVAFAGDKVGQQVGLTSIGQQYKSEHFGGPMNDLDPDSWSTAENLYLKLHAQDPKTFPYEWNGSSSLSWFCAGVPDPNQQQSPSSGSPVTDPTPDIEITCNDADEPDYDSYSKSGDLSINVDVKNNRTWIQSSSKVYARPGDNIIWYNKYNATTPELGEEEVSTVNGDKVGEYEDLSDSYCQPNGGLCSGLTPITNKRLDGKVDPWENQFTTYIERQGTSGFKDRLEKNDFTYGKNENVNKTEERSRQISATDDVGTTITETAKAGTYELGYYSTDSGNKTGIPSYIKIKTASPQPSKTATNTYYTYEKVRTEVLISRMVNGEEWEFIIPESEVDIATDTVISSVDVYGNKPHEKDCTNRYEDTFVEATVEQDEKKDDASVDVPYNYKNYTGVVINSPYIYAGETVTVDKIMMDVGPKYNGVTQDTYATKVPYATTRLFAYASDSSNGRGATSNYTISWSSDGCAMIGGAAKDGQCVEMPSLHTIYTLNSAGNLGLYEDYYNSLSYEDKRWANRYDYENNYRVYSGYLGERTYNAFDIAAGDYMCFVAAIYPASSGSDYQMGTQGDEMWRYSSPTCVVVAKKPTFQVWGGDIYSVNKLYAATASKRNVYRSYIGNVRNNFTTSGGGATYFGSWSEHGVTIKDASTSTVASGASTAPYGNSGPFCKDRSPLTFSNDCSRSSSSAGNSGIPSGVGNNRDDLIKYWLGSDYGDLAKNGSDWIEINTDGGGIIEYQHVTGNWRYETTDQQDGGTIMLEKGKTKIWVVDGRATFRANFKIPAMSNVGVKDIPKFIVYAQNINILCDVTEIHAILITKPGGKIRTCVTDDDRTSTYEIPDANSSKRSKQLRIFGTVITDYIDLDRTYGGGATKNLSSDNHEVRQITNEDKPAEIFDFDPTILLWTEQRSSTTETSSLQTVYQKEVAPRY